MKLRDLFTRKLPVNTDKIEQAIRHLETKTSAELRVLVERKVKKDTGSAIDHAQKIFNDLKMDQTQARNGVLIYLAFKPQYVAIIGDEGIHQKVGNEFWTTVYDAMKQDCQNKQFTQAICKGIQEVEKQLEIHYPIQENDINELPNEVIIK